MEILYCRYNDCLFIVIIFCYRIPVNLTHFLELLQKTAHYYMFEQKGKNIQIIAVFLQNKNDLKNREIYMKIKLYLWCSIFKNSTLILLRFLRDPVYNVTLIASFRKILKIFS